jgi:glutaredoxin 2
MIQCEKHGDITESAFIIQYFDKSSGRGILKRKIYCLECISEYLDKLSLPKITEVKDANSPER